MPRQPRSFRVGRVNGYLRGRIWYLQYHENGQRRRPRVGSSDADGDILTYGWTVRKNGAASPFVTSSDLAFTFTPNDDGNYVATLTVNDGRGGAHSDQV
jgi:hypothetical protein